MHIHAVAYLEIFKYIYFMKNLWKGEIQGSFNMFMIWLELEITLLDNWI